uniref:Uncharacterized protein n=1 Tax=Meloidogyne floridensis TaxID=298350 RepID=A0A915NDQ1_9BILA
MVNSSTKICLFFLSIFILFQLSNSQCPAGSVAFGGKCKGKGKGNCCAGLCSKGICCLNEYSVCNDINDKRCCPGYSCQQILEPIRAYKCLANP